MQNHIVKSFDEEIEHLKSEIITMAKACSSQLEKSVIALHRMDKDLAAKVVKDDRKINDFQREIEDNAVRYLAKRQPMAIDLRYLLSAMKISYELERVGDNAENIAAAVRSMAETISSEAIDSIVDMAGICKIMLHDLIDAFSELDTDKSIAVWKRDTDINARFLQVKSLVVQEAQANGGCFLHDGYQLIHMARCCERVGDHLKNIAEDIHYIATGDPDIRQAMNS